MPWPQPTRASAASPSPPTPDSLFVKEDTLVFYGGNTALKGSAVIAGLHSVNQPDSTSGKISKNLLYKDAFTYDDCDFLEVGAFVPYLLSP